MESLWSRRSMIVFFAIGFGLPWLGWTTIALLEPQGPVRTMLFYTGDFMSVGGLVATWVAGGRPALASLGRRLIAVRAPIGWSLFAIFSPLIWLTIPRLWSAAQHGGIGRIDPMGLLVYLAPATLIAFTTGPLGEEAGWRGYFLPRLLTRYRPITASVILGLIWGIWHLPLYIKSIFATVGGGAGFVLHTILFSILLTAIWAFTGGSVFWAIIFHYTINITPRVLSGLFPDVKYPFSNTDPVEIASLVAVAVGVVVVVGPARLAARIREVLAGLDQESITADRAAVSR